MDGENDFSALMSKMTEFLLARSEDTNYEKRQELSAEYLEEMIGTVPRLNMTFNEAFYRWLDWAQRKNPVGFRRDNKFMISLRHPEYAFDLENMRLRLQLSLNTTWAIPTTNALLGMLEYAENGKIAEIGCGAGYWATQLAQLGGIITCCDIKKDPRMTIGANFEFKEIDAEAFVIENEGFPQHALFIGYGHRNANNSYNAAIKAFKGSFIYIVGERDDGCTFSMFYCETAENWEEVRSFELPLMTMAPFGKLRDELIIYRRRF